MSDVIHLELEGDNGSLWFWDWKSGHNFQQAQTIVQPGTPDLSISSYQILEISKTLVE